MDRIHHARDLRAHDRRDHRGHLSFSFYAHGRRDHRGHLSFSFYAHDHDRHVHQKYFFL